MIRRANWSDVDALVNMVESCKAVAGWGQVHNPGWTLYRVHEFVVGQLVDPSSICYINEDRRSACGVKIQPMAFPPHLPTAFEWVLWGSNAAACWKAAIQTAKSRGAVWACRQTHGQGTAQHVTTTVKWSRL